MNEKFSRQSFLGNLSQMQIQELKIAVVGYGGGGSQIGQQLLHLGFEKIQVFDDDVVEDSNCHRLLGVHYPSDVLKKMPKVEVAKRMAQNIQGQCKIETFKCKWQEASDNLLDRQIVVGCLDSFDERDQLEKFCRRNLIAYVDIGMIVRQIGDEPPQMAGQIILSMPGYSCMRCMGFLTEEKLNDDRSRYGDAGPQPQVIWANGVLGSFAVGIIADLATNWSNCSPAPIYLSYDANNRSVSNHPRLLNLKTFECEHYSPEAVGDYKYKRI